MRYNSLSAIKSVGLIVGLATSVAMAADVSDFSPLQIGNTWTYQGSYNHRNSFSVINQYKIRRMFRVDSVVAMADSIVYHVLQRDSLYEHSGELDPATAPIIAIINGDTIRATHGSFPDSYSEGKISIVEKQGNLTGGGYFFRVHSAPITSMVGKVQVLGQTRWAFSPERESGAGVGLCVSSFENCVYAQGVGLLRYGYQFSTNQSWTRSFDLIEFNGQKIDSATVTGLRPGRQANPGAATRKAGQGMIRGTFRDIRGRVIESPFTR